MTIYIYNKQYKYPYNLGASLRDFSTKSSIAHLVSKPNLNNVR